MCDWICALRDRILSLGNDKRWDVKVHRMSNTFHTLVWRRFTLYWCTKHWSLNWLRHISLTAMSPGNINVLLDTKPYMNVRYLLIKKRINNILNVMLVRFGNICSLPPHTWSTHTVLRLPLLMTIINNHTAFIRLTLSHTRVHTYLCVCI